MSEYYTLVQEGLDQWINSPDNGGECCQTSRETVDELNRLINRIKRLEEAGDFIVSRFGGTSASDVWRKAKEVKP